MANDDRQRASATPADIERNRWPASIGTRWPTSIGMPGRVHRNPQTGQRLGDIAEASWPEIAAEKDVLTVPPTRFKTDVAQEVPLGPTATAILESLPTFKGDYIFTTTGGERPLGAFHPPKQRLQALIDSQRQRDGLPVMPHWVLHDLRRTVRTRLTSECNIDAFIAERVIGHLLPGLHRVYDQGAHRAQKKAALLVWEAHLLSVVEPGRPAGSNVVALAERHRA